MSDQPAQAPTPPRPPPRLRILPHLAIPIEGDVLQLQAAAVSARIKGPHIEAIFARVVGLLDGSRSEAQVIDASGAKEGMRRAARFLLEALARNRLLEEFPGDGEAGPVDLGGSLGDYFALLTLNRTRSLAAMRRSRVWILGSGALAQRLLRSLERLELQCEARPWPDGEVDTSGASHVVALVGAPAAVAPQAQRLNDTCIASGTPFTPVALVGGDVVQIGPTVLPGITACLGCVREHFQRANPLPTDIDELVGGRHRGAEAEPWLSGTAASLVALELLRSVSATRLPASSSTVVTLDLASMSAARTPFTKIPRCRHCGATRNTPPLRLWA